MNAPSVKNAWFNAANVLFAVCAYLPRCFSMSAESVASAAERFSMRTPPPTGLMLESFAEKNPFTNTSRWPGSLVKVDSAISLVSAPLTTASRASWNGSCAMGATLVKRQSSSLNFGKPSSAKPAMPALRNGSSHFGWGAAGSNRENFSTNNSVPLFSFCIMFRISLIKNQAPISHAIPIDASLHWRPHSKRQPQRVEIAAAGLRHSRAPQTCFRARSWQPVRHVVTGRNPKRAEGRQISGLFARYNLLRPREGNFRRQRRGQRDDATDLAES